MGGLHLYICYIDESGTSEIPGTTSHYILAGIAIPIDKWKECDDAINIIKKKYLLDDNEIHTAWILRKYYFQNKINNFEDLGYADRRFEVQKLRNSKLLDLQKKNNHKQYKQTKKNFIQTKAYIHLTLQERQSLIKEIAQTVSGWNFVRLFAECIDKVFFNPSLSQLSVDEQAFEQVISRFEHYLEIVSRNFNAKQFGLIAHDNNATVAKRHTNLMKKFHKTGTLWTNIRNIIETPFFVDSELTSMIQIADICSYALRRYIENDEDELLKLIHQCGDRKDGRCVGVRHFSESSCSCEICKAH